MFSDLVHPPASYPVQARGAPCRHHPNLPLDPFPNWEGWCSRVLQLCAMAWLGLLGSPMFQRHMVRLILVGCETWVSHRLE